MEARWNNVAAFYFISSWDVLKPVVFTGTMFMTIGGWPKIVLMLMVCTGPILFHVELEINEVNAVLA